MLLLMILPMFVTQGPNGVPNTSSTKHDQSSPSISFQTSTPDPHGGVVVANVTVGRQATGVAYDEANRCVYVTNGSSNSTSVLSGTSVVATIPVGWVPHGVAYDPRNGYVYVANTNSPLQSFSVINGSTVVGTIRLARSPWEVAYDSANGYVYMTIGGGVLVINGTSILATITAGVGLIGFPAISYDSTNGYIYVTDYDGNMVHVIRDTTVIANVTVGNYPEGVGYDSGNGYVYVTNRQDNTVSVINGTAVVATVPVGMSPVGVAYAGSNGYVYVTDSGGSSVSVIDDTTVVDTIPVQEGPWGVAYDSANRYVYVATTSYQLNRPSVVNVISTTSDYRLSNSGPATITAGQTGNVTIVTQLTSSPSVAVRLSCESPPSGIICQAFSQNPVSPDLKGVPSVLTINVASSVAPGDYNLAVTSAPLGETTAGTSISITVNAKPSLILGLDPTVFYAIIAGAVIGVAALTVVYRVTRQRRKQGSSNPIIASNPRRT